MQCTVDVAVGVAISTTPPPPSPPSTPSTRRALDAADAAARAREEVVTAEENEKNGKFISHRPLRSRQSYTRRDSLFSLSIWL